MSSTAESVGDALPFTFNQLSDAQIAFIGRSFIHGIEQQIDNGFGMAQNDFVGEAVIKLFGVEMGRLIDESPRRAKAFLKQAAISTDEYDRRMAVGCANELAKRDFPLARDLLAYGGEPDDVISATRQIEQWATPEQMEELETARQVARDQWPPEFPPSLLS